MQAGQPLYGAFLQLQNKLCVVIGGGQVGRRKVEKLLSARARIHVISPDAHEDIAAWAAQGRIEWYRRPYCDGDLEGAWLIYAATSDPLVNQSIRTQAEATGRFVNVTDDADACTLLVPSVLQVGAVQVAISTSGTNPSLAKRLRLALEQDLQRGTRCFQEELLMVLKDTR